MVAFADRYGRVNFAGVDISASPCLSIDMRAMLGFPAADETREHPPGTFRVSVFASRPGHLPVGEVRLAVGGMEVSLVGALTGRPGVREITPGHVLAVGRDPAYADALRRGIGLVQ